MPSAFYNKKAFQSTFSRSAGAEIARLDIVAVTVEDKCRIVVGSVLGPKSWGAVVLRARFESGTVEVAYLLLALCEEGDMRRRKLLFLRNPQRSVPTLFEAFRLLSKEIHRTFVSEGFKRLRKKDFRLSIIADEESNVFEHMADEITLR